MVEMIRCKFRPLVVEAECKERNDGLVEHVRYANSTRLSRNAIVHMLVTAHVENAAEQYGAEVDCPEVWRFPSITIHGTCCTQ